MSVAIEVEACIPPTRPPASIDSDHDASACRECGEQVGLSGYCVACGTITYPAHKEKQPG